MPAMSTIRTYVRYRLGNRSDLQAGEGLTMLNEWINMANREVSHTHRFDILERIDSTLTTNATDAYVTVPSDVYAVLSVFDTTNKFQLAPFEGDWQDYRRETANDTKGKPTRWIREAGRIYLKDQPAGAYVLECLFQINPPTLSGANDTPLIPVVWHDAVKILAVRNGWNDLGEEARAAEAESEYMRFVAKIRTPKSIERTVPTRRGAYVQQWVTNPRKGL